MRKRDCLEVLRTPNGEEDLRKLAQKQLKNDLQAFNFTDKTVLDRIALKCKIYVVDHLFGIKA